MKPKTIILAIVLAIFGLLFILKGMGVFDSQVTTVGTGGTGQTTGDPNAIQLDPNGPALKKVDAVAMYDQALAEGKPVYVLFHSLCASCLPAAALVEQVIPDYDGSVVYINALTSEASTIELARRFAFQYTPTGVFIDGEGNQTDLVTGIMTEAELRAALDKIAQ